jgi:antitoxin HigA-1
MTTAKSVLEEQREIKRRMLKNGMPPFHPGEMLREVLDELQMSGAAFAEALSVPASRMTEILGGKRGITADTALRLSRYLGTSAEFWLNLQTSYELRTAERSSGKAIARAVKPRAA